MVEDAGWCIGVVVAEAGLAEVFLEVGEVGSEHFAEGFEDFFLGGFCSAVVSEEAGSRHNPFRGSLRRLTDRFPDLGKAETFPPCRFGSYGG